MQAELVLDAKATLGEGAIWDSRDNALWWVDIEKHSLFRFEPATGENRTYPLPSRVGTVVPRLKGGVSVALENGFHHFDPASGRLEFIADPESGRDDNRFNDGKCDPAGRFWAGTMTLVGKAGAGALYCLDPDGTVHRRLEGVTISNGICWSPDHRIMYYIDTPVRSVDAFDYDFSTGEISNRRKLVQIEAGQGAPDGMTIDSRGFLWVAHWGGARVTCWNPQDGSLVQTVELPVSRVTSCAFGGPKLETLFITTASSGMKDEERAREPHAGSLFACQPGVSGVPAFPYMG